MNSLTEKQLEEKRKKEYYTDLWIAKKLAAGKISASTVKENKLREQFPRIFNRARRGKPSSPAPCPHPETPTDKPPPVSDS